jgi:hypothetical protein
MLREFQAIFCFNLMLLIRLSRRVSDNDFEVALEVPCSISQRAADAAKMLFFYSCLPETPKSARPKAKT